MIGTTLFTFFKGKLVGKDYYGNCYFEEKFLFNRKPGSIRPRRWVMYKGDNEASKVVPEWHRWLHYTSNELPSNEVKLKDWQKPHVPNMTGTPKAYNPAIMLENGEDNYYISWKPK